MTSLQKLTLKDSLVERVSDLSTDNKEMALVLYFFIVEDVLSEEQIISVYQHLCRILSKPDTAKNKVDIMQKELVKVFQNKKASLSLFKEHFLFAVDMLSDEQVEKVLNQLIWLFYIENKKYTTTADSVIFCDIDGTLNKLFGYTGQIEDRYMPLLKKVVESADCSIVLC